MKEACSSNKINMCTHLDVGLGVYLVHSVAWGPASLVVEEVALNKDTVLTHTPNPHLSLILLVQNHS